MTVKKLTEHYLEFLSLKRGCKARLSLHMSNATLLEITCQGSIIESQRQGTRLALALLQCTDTVLIRL